jgi:hypothetical protein
MLTNAEFHKRFANTYVSSRPAGNGLNHEAVGLLKRNRGIERSALVAATILTSKSVVDLHHNQGGHLARIEIVAYCLATNIYKSRCASCSRTPFSRSKTEQKGASLAGFLFPRLGAAVEPCDHIHTTQPFQF